MQKTPLGGYSQRGSLRLQRNGKDDNLRGHWQDSAIGEALNPMSGLSVGITRSRLTFYLCPSIVYADADANISVSFNSYAFATNLYEILCAFLAESP